MTDSLVVEPLATLICDDVRTEENGKEILIGVYTGAILFESLPATIPLCVWINILVRETGEVPLAMRIVDSTDKELMRFEGRAAFEKSEDATSLAVPKFPLTIEQDTFLRFEWKIADHGWESLAVKRAKLGARQRSKNAS